MLADYRRYFSELQVGDVTNVACGRSLNCSSDAHLIALEIAEGPRKSNFLENTVDRVGSQVCTPSYKVRGESRLKVSIEIDISRD